MAGRERYQEYRLQGIENKDINRAISSWLVYLQLL